MPCTQHVYDSPSISLALTLSGSDGYLDKLRYCILSCSFTFVSINRCSISITTSQHISPLSESKLRSSDNKQLRNTLLRPHLSLLYNSCFNSNFHRRLAACLPKRITLHTPFTCIHNRTIVFLCTLAELHAQYALHARTLVRE